MLDNDFYAQRQGSALHIYRFDRKVATSYLRQVSDTSFYFNGVVGGSSRVVGWEYQFEMSPFDSVFISQMDCGRPIPACVSIFQVYDEIRAFYNEIGDEF